MVSIQLNGKDNSLCLKLQNIKLINDQRGDDVKQEKDLLSSNGTVSTQALTLN